MSANKNKPFLTIGMSAYDDFPGVYMTIQALKLYQDVRHCELVVVDNHPNNADGTDSKAIRNLVEGMSTKNFLQARYFPLENPVGTTIPRQMIFDMAEGQYVMVMDSHVMLIPGALAALKEHYTLNPDSKDIISGPLFNDMLGMVGTHFNYIWRAEMWGRWGQAYRCPICDRMFSCNDEPTDGKVHYLDLMGQIEGSPIQASYIEGCTGCGHTFPKDIPWPGHERILVQQGYKSAADPIKNVPFEIPAMGLGLFACRKDAWAGWGYDCRGFGGEECCIHDIHRKEMGGKVICLPKLAWTHRFAHKQPLYPLNTWNKVRNYILFFKRLGYDLGPIYDHFVPTGKIEKHAIDFIASDPVNRVWPIGGKHLVDRNTPEGRALIQQLETGQPQPQPESQQQSPSNTYREMLAAAEREAKVAEQAKSGCSGCGSGSYHVQPDMAAPWTPDTLYDWLKTVPRDLDQHMPKIREYADRCEHVTDVGHRRESITAILASKAPSVVVYSREASDPVVQKMLEMVKETKAVTIQPPTLTEGVHSVQTEIDETDMLFIDTTMTFDRVLRVLDTFSPKVRKYIIIHDTQLFMSKGEDGGPGIMAAVRIWLRKNPEWKPVYITKEQYGLVVYSKLPEDRPPLPNLAKKVFNFTLHAAAHITTGAKATPDDILEKRLDICANCEARNLETCSACGCPLARKAPWAEQFCDHGKWGPYVNEVDHGIPS